MTIALKMKAWLSLLLPRAVGLECALHEGLLHATAGIQPEVGVVSVHKSLNEGRGSAEQCRSVVNQEGRKRPAFRGSRTS